MLCFEEKLIELQLELMSGMSYELYVSEETYKVYMQSFLKAFKESQALKA